MASHQSCSLDHVLSAQLAQRKERNLLRSLETPAHEQGLVDFSSNDYLSLSKNADIRQDYLSFLLQQSSSTTTRTRTTTTTTTTTGRDDGEDQGGPPDFGLGSGGSRLLDGNSTFAETLERRLADFHGAAAALLFNSGYEANTGLFSAVPQTGDVVVYDEFIHASVHAGMKLSRAATRTVRFRHNAVWDNNNKSSRGGGRGGAEEEEEKGLEPMVPASLDQTLRRLLEEGRDGAEISQGRRHVFVAVEALYSMDGDLAPLHDIVQCVEQHLPRGNGHVIVDEAHSNGVLGSRGRGLVCALGLEKRVWATVLTFGKAMGCSGAVVLCTPITRAYLVNYARSFIYTTAMGFPALASIHVVHSYVARGRADAVRQRLVALVQHMRTRLAVLCGATGTAHGHDDGPSSAVLALVGIRAEPSSSSSSLPQQLSPILPVFTPKARSLAAFCRGRGYMVRPIVAPTVPLGTDRVRICLHAGNSLEECEGLCEAIEAWVRAQQQQQQKPPCPGEVVVDVPDEDRQEDIKPRL